MLKAAIPNPARPKTVLAPVLGHLEFVSPIFANGGVKGEKGTPSMAMYKSRVAWYDETNSDTYALQFPGRKLVVSRDPAVFREVLGPKQKHFTNSDGFRKTFGYFFTNSVIVTEGEQWKRIRKVIQRAVGLQDLNTTVIPHVAETLDDLFDYRGVSKSEGKVGYNVLALTTPLTFDVFHRIMYNWNPRVVKDAPESREILDACLTISESIGHRGMAPIPWMWKLPTSYNRKVDTALTTLMAAIDKFVAEQEKRLGGEAGAKAREAPAASLIDALILAGTEEKLTKQELKDNIGTLFFGAFDTTSAQLAFLLYHLAADERVQTKLRAQLKQAFPNGRKDLERATMEDLETKVPYLGSVVDEVHRLHAVAWAFSRTCLEDVELSNGMVIPKGSEVMFDHSATSRDPRHWNGATDLDSFRPERFEEFRPDATSNLPFGFGGRICPGRKIALAEMKAAVALVIMDYDVKPSSESLPMDLMIRLVLSPKDGTGMVIFKKLE